MSLTNEAANSESTPDSTDFPSTRLARAGLGDQSLFGWHKRSASTITNEEDCDEDFQTKSIYR
jgi:hypothetical protein